jgi:hypothetical protein
MAAFVNRLTYRNTVGLSSLRSIISVPCNRQLNAICLSPLHHHDRKTILGPDRVISYRWYSPMTKDEEEVEKKRVTSLTAFQKDQELRKLNREIARLELLKGINTGDAYKWSGRYKALARDYGMPLIAWYWTVWATTGFLSYGAITVFNIDVMSILAQFDARTGWDLVSKVDPQYGKIGMALVLNEILEPLRFPLVVVTVKPLIDNFFPRKF